MQRQLGYHVLLHLGGKMSHKLYTWKGASKLKWNTNNGANLLNHLGGKMAPKLVYFVLEKAFLNLCETAVWFIISIMNVIILYVTLLSGGYEHVRCLSFLTKINSFLNYI